MLHSPKLCLYYRFKQAKKLLQKLTSCKRKSIKAHKPASDLSCLLTSSLASQLEQVFNLIDANGDGKISPVELTQLLRNLGHDKAEAAKEAEVMVREMDCDGDGYVDLDEFISVIETDRNEGSANGNCAGGDIMEAFRVFDADSNGFISAKELQRVLGKLGCGKYSVRECKKMIRGVDRDGDGFVSFEEFKDMMSVGCV